MINKKLIKITILIIAIFGYISHAYADNNYVPFNAVPNMTDPDDVVDVPPAPDDAPPKAAMARLENKKLYECYSNASANGGMYLMLKFTNHKKQQILNKDLTFQNVAFKAGTWIGVSTEEHRQGSWSVDVEIKERRKKWTCYWEKETKEKEPICKSDDGDENKDYDREDQMGCREGYTPDYGTYTVAGTITTSKDSDGGITDPTEACGTNGSAVFIGGEVTEEYLIAASNKTLEDECLNAEEDKAIAKVEEEMGKEPNNIWYITNNVYPKNLASITMQKLSQNTTLDEKPCEKDPDPDVHSGDCYSIVAHRPTNVCLNRKTAMVKYDTGITGCETDELNVTGWTETFENENPQLEHYLWRYFIPLNTKSGTDNWYIRIQSGVSNLAIKQCKAIIKNYPSNYTDYIVPISSGEFSGEALKDNETIDVDKGCKLMIKFSFNIKQEFYHETKNKEIKGYEFYYRPIDITNPFPNGIDKYSYWYEWSTTSKLDRINLADSFSKIFYSTKNNINAIREYNDDEENPYTSWAKIDLKGTSEFVKKYLNIEDDSKKHYELGCGPGTEDLEECK